MKLKNAILTSIKEHPSLRMALMDLHEISEYTLLKWLRINYSSLTLYDSLQLIAAYLKQDIDGLIIKEEKDFKEVV